MTDKELIDWNLRFCPKCKGHINYHFGDNGNNFSTILRNCQNFPKCDYSQKITNQNINSIDRHKLIETYFGYSRKFSLTKNEFENNFLPKLFFTNVKDFLKWFFNDLNLRIGINHNYLPVASPYPSIILDLVKFVNSNYLPDFICEFAMYSLSTKNYDKLLENLNISRNKSLYYIEYYKISTEIQLNTDFINSQENEFEYLLNSIISKTDNYEVWQLLFNSFTKSDLINITRKIFDQYQKTQNTKFKSGIQGLYLLLTNNILLENDEFILNLTDYILEKTKDNYLPFISTNYNAKNIKQYIELQRIDETINRFLQNEKLTLDIEIKLKDTEIQNAKNEINKLQKKIETDENIISSKNKSINRIDYLQQFINLSPLEKVRKIITDTNSIHYFPEIFFDGFENEIQNLNSTEKGLLIAKLKTINKGKLKELKILLTNK